MRKIVTVTLPDIGEGVVEGEVIEWRKEVGDPLQQDEPVVIVMTDKATVELPAPYPGKLLKQYYQPGQVAVKDKPLYDIELSTEIAELPQQKETTLKSASLVEKSPPKRKPPEKPAATKFESIKALTIPAVRHLAKQLGIDLQEIEGTGRGGQVTMEDLKGSIQRPMTGPIPQCDDSVIQRLPGDFTQPLIGIRHLMAKKMMESKTRIPHFSYFEQVDVTRLIQLREKFKNEAAKENISVTFMPLFIRALSLSLVKYPIVNSSVDIASGQLIIHKQQNIGIAISTKHGLIVPVLKNVQEMTLPDLIRKYAELMEKARADKLTSSDMKEGTVTISNFGSLGGGAGLWATPIITHPEVAILAVAKIQKQPMVKNEMIVIRDILNLSWSFDHRIIDGELAATFSHYFASLLLNPAPLI